MRRALTNVALACLLPLVFCLSACATYQVKVDEARREFALNPEAAVQHLEPMAKEEGRDQLVYLLDYATALQVAGRYEESSKAFIKAEQVAELKDYHSISNVAGSLVLNEEMVQYKGDDFEKVLINGLNAINFLELGKLDDALVEARRVNEKLHKLKIDGKKEFNQSPFAFYLSAMIWEADKKYDDAYIAYKDAYAVAPEYRPLREDLIRSAIKAQRSDELEKWKREFPEVQIRPEWKDRTMGEVIFIFQQGWGPRKVARPENHRFPRLVAVSNRVTAARVTLAREGKDETLSHETSSIYSIQDIAIRAIEDDFGRLVGSRVAGIATKAVVSDQIAQQNKALGQLAWIAMNIADRADLRQWSTLPASFQVARIPVRPGTYKIEALGLEGAFPSGTKMNPRTLKVMNGQKVFLSWRAIE